MHPPNATKSRTVYDIYDNREGRRSSLTLIFRENSVTDGELDVPTGERGEQQLFGLSVV